MAEAGKAGQKKQRRSPRRELALPIRVFGTTAAGRDFTEDCVCVKVSPHGGQIRLTHTLINDEEIRIINLRTKKEAEFRVVAQVSSPPDKPYADWGVEALEPDEDFWKT